MGLTSLPAQLAGILVLGIGIAYWLGYGVTRWLLPREWLGYRWLAMPAVGLAVFAVVAQPLGLVGVNAGTLAWVMFLLVLVGNVSARSGMTAGPSCIVNFEDRAPRNECAA